MAAFVVALAARAIGWTVACPPRPKICTKQPWCRSPPSGWSTIYLYIHVYIYLFRFLFRSVLSHRSRQVWAESLRPSTPGAVPVQAQARHPTKKQKKIIPAASPQKATTVPHFMHTHTHTSCRAFPALGPLAPPPSSNLHDYTCKHTAEFCRTRSRVLKKYMYMYIHTSVYIYIYKACTSDIYIYIMEYQTN